MFQLYKNIQTDFLGQIFVELFQFKTRSLFLGDPVKSTMNPSFPATFLPKTLSRKLDFCLLTLMNFNDLEFKADFKNRIFYAMNIMYQYHFIFISNFTHVAALLFELLLSLLSLHVAVCTVIFA